MWRTEKIVKDYGGGCWRGGRQGQVMTANVLWKETGHGHFSRKKGGNWSNEYGEILGDSSRRTFPKVVIKLVYFHLIVMEATLQQLFP